MMAEATNPDAGVQAENPKPDIAPPKNGPNTPRKIPGNLPYLTASGTLKKVLDKIIEASRPDRFSHDFVENKLNITGGAARATVPILKKAGFIASDGSPTELYARFRTEGGRASAALQGLKSGFPEIFKRSEYAHAVDDHKLRDIIVEITGLKPSDSVAKAIKGTFNVFKEYIPTDFEPSAEAINTFEDASSTLHSEIAPTTHRTINKQNHIGLSYNINIVLPETSDLRVLNAIFRSLKENMLQ